MKTFKVTVIVHETGERRELIFDGIQSGPKGIEFNHETATLTLWTEKGNLLNIRHVIPFVSYWSVEDELAW